MLAAGKITSSDAELSNLDALTLERALRRYFEERVFKPAVTKSGVAESLTFHGLRHIAASLMVEQGEHPQVIQARLGHPTARLSMELYAHVPEATDRDVP